MKSFSNQSNSVFSLPIAMPQLNNNANKVEREYTRITNLWNRIDTTNSIPIQFSFDSKITIGLSNEIILYVNVIDFTINIQDDEAILGYMAHEYAHYLNKDYSRNYNLLTNLEKRTMEHYADMKAIEILNTIRYSYKCLVKAFMSWNTKRNILEYYDIDKEIYSHYSLYRRLKNVLTVVGDL